MRRLLPFVAVLVWGCSPSPQGTANHGSSEVTGASELDAPPEHVELVDSFASPALFAVLDERTAEVRLLDPNTGKWSQTLPIAPEPSLPIAFSPNGRDVVYGVAEGPLGRTWVVASLSIGADGAPLLTETVRFDTHSTKRRPVWNGRGDRFFTQTGWFDPGAARSFECPATTARLMASPDGRHAVLECSSDAELDGVLYDGELVHPQVFEDYFTADGQILSSGVHVPTRAELIADLKPARAYSGSEVGGPASRFHTVGTGLAGVRAQEISGVFGKVIREWGPSPTQNRVTDGVEYHGGQTAEPAAQWSGAADQLLELPGATHGATAQFAGFHPNGRQAMYVTALWDTRSDSINDTSINILHSQRVALVDVATGAVDQVVERGLIAGRDGEYVTDVDDYWFGGIEELQLAYRWPYGEQPKHAAIMREDRALMRLGNTWWGIDAERAFTAPWPAQVPRSDGGGFVGNFRTRTLYQDDFIGGVCANDGEADSQVRCIRTKIIPRVIAVGGHAVAGLAPTEEGARIWSVSQSAGFEGQEITIFGTGFGDRGALSIGEQAIDEGAIVSWADTEIKFIVPASAPSGRVVVEGPRGAALARPFYFHRTERLVTGWEELESPAVDLYAGLNVLAHAGELVPWRPVALNASIFPLGEEIDVEADLGVRGSWVYINASFESRTEFLVGDRIDEWVRPVPGSVGPGAPAALEGWNPFGAASWPALAPIQFVTMMGRLVEQGSCVVYERTEDGNIASAQIQRPNLQDPCPQAFLDEGGTALAVRTKRAVGPHLMRLAKLEETRIASGKAYDMVFDDSVTTPLPIGMSAIAELEGKRFLVGRMENDQNSAAWVLDPALDGQKTPEVSDEARRPLGNVAALSAGPLRGFIAVELPTSIEPVAPSIVHFSEAGEVTWDALAAPFPDGGSSTLRFWSQGPVLLAHQAGAQPDYDGGRAAWIDTSAPDASWAPLVLPEGDIVSVFDDRPRDRLVVASRSAIYELARDVDGFGSPELLGEPSLTLFEVEIQIYAVGVTPDGSLVIQTSSEDARPGKEGNTLPFGGWYWLPSGA